MMEPGPEVPPPEKVKRAAHLLFFRRGHRPGARDWELKNRIGPNYPAVLERLNDLLKDLDLEVKPISDAGPDDDGTARRYVVVLKGTMAAADARLSGWRIDTLSGLAASMALVLARQGKIPREELEDLLADKFGRWRSDTLVDLYERAGYLAEDSEGFVGLGWRAYAEVDAKELVTRLLAARTVETAAPEESPESDGTAGPGSS